MKISNKVKRNIFLILTIIGILNCIGSVLEIIFNTGSLKEWMHLCAAFGLTLFAFAYFYAFNKRLKKGITFGY